MCCSEPPKHEPFPEGKWVEVMNTVKECGMIEAECIMCSSKHTILNYFCQRDTPLNVVEEIYTVNPDSVFEKDCQDRYPLHIAANNNASAEVIQFLVEQNPAAVSSKDKQGKYPIHLAF